MQRLASSYYKFYKFWVVPILLSSLVLGFTACGGGGSSKGSSSTNQLVILSTATNNALSSFSIGYGDVQGLRAELRDSTGAPVSTTSSVTWTTDAPTIAGITPTGAVCGNSSNTYTCICGGQWQNSNVDCIAPSAPSTATVTALASTGETASITVYVHPRVSRVAITTPAANDCTSSTGTLQLTAQAYDSNGNSVNIGPDATSFTWSTSDATVATADTTGLITAANPGKNNVFASVEGHNSAPYQFTTCGVKSIHIHVKDSTDTSFTGDVASTKTLVADILDTKGKSITIANSRLTWAANVPGVITLDQSGGATLNAAGSSGIVAGCVPPQCNSGLTSIYSNVVTANVNGTSSTFVYAANSSGTTVIPIDTSTNTAGTAITLPYNPNSMVFAPTGTKLFLGSATSLMIYDPVQATVTPYSNLPGTVIGASDNAQYVAIYNPVAGTISNVDTSANTVVDSFSVSGIPNPCSTATSNKCPHASYTPDSRTAFIVAGSNLYISTTSSSLKTIPLGVAANDVAVTAQGSFAFVANNDATLVPFATCNNTRLNSNIVGLSASAQRLIRSYDGTTMYALSPPNLNLISTSTDGVGCVPSLTDPLNTTVDLGQGAFVTQQIIPSTEDDRIYFVTGGNNIVVYDKDNGGSAISLSAGANALSGGLTPDGAQLYVGGSDNNIHRIDTTTKTDAGQISVSFTPDLVAVRPK